MSDEQRIKRYRRLYIQIEELLAKSDNIISNLATINAILFHKLNDIFWLGFYFVDGDVLSVGSYQGPVACQELEKNTGVCWTAVNQKKTIIVEDVHSFPGHIACDSRSNSEIVVPLFKGDDVIAVLDIDSRKYSRFDNIDKEGIENILSLLKV